MERFTDNELMSKVKGGDLEHLGVLFERYQTLLFSTFMAQIGNRASSEDLVQEVFMRILKYRETFRNDNEFSTWMYTIAKNALLNVFRKHQ